MIATLGLSLPLLDQLQELSVHALPAAGVTALLYAAWKVFRMFYSNLTSPLRAIPGPTVPWTSFIVGHMKQISDAENSVLQEAWIKQYGQTIKYKGFLGSNRLCTMDTKAINHVLMNAMDYEKPEQPRRFLTAMLGQGVLVTEGEHHKLQRKVMNPAFGPAQIRELTPVFLEKSIQMRDIWAAQASSSPAQIDVLHWLGRMTLDVIGIAGFGYEFNALTPDGPPNELNTAFSSMFDASMNFGILDIAKNLLPFLGVFPSERDRIIKGAKAIMVRIGSDLLRDSKASILVDGSASQRRDLLSLLVKSNTSNTTGGLTDDDVLAQIPTFLVAGHETTSAGTTWALFQLTQSPEVQTKLREELQRVSSDMPSMDELNALPYLDMVVRETLRIHAPVAGTLRTAVKDDVIPLETPYMDSDGLEQDSIRVRKGDQIFIPILPLNRSEAIWGPDAMEFKPERWESIPDEVGKLPGVWGGMSFLGGPRGCIGYRFSIVEMKALLFTLVRAFEFELAVPAADIGKKSVLVQRPFVKSDRKAGNQMPIIVTAVSAV